MTGMSGSELLFYGGIAVMAAVVAGAILCVTVFCITGRRLKQKMEQEYGKPLR